MHDLRFIRENPALFDAALARRGMEPQSAALLALDEERRALTTQLQAAQSRRNDASKEIGVLTGEANRKIAQKMREIEEGTRSAPIISVEDPRLAALKAEMAEIKATIAAWEKREKALGSDLEGALAVLPNLPADDVPDGAGEEDNKVKKEWGTPRVFDFTPKEHADLAPALGMDFETGARLSGARFTFLRGDMARLHRALGQFMLDVQTREHGYEECNPPVLVGDEAMYGTDKLPKFAGDSFETSIEAMSEWLRRSIEVNFIEVFEPGVVPNAETRKALAAKILDDGTIARGSRRWLIPTSEVSLTASVMGELLDEAALPLRLTALTLCFRSEAGAAGRDTRGFIRQHQFEKCELVSIVRPEDSEAEHERMTRAAETILERLDLPYRKLLLCSGDMGFGARKTYDLEVWLPGQGAYREISSCSNTGAFQARRMNTRYRVAGEKKTEFVHTLNGSGLAVGRTLVAVLENYQQADGSVLVPDALRGYMGGITKLEIPHA